MVFAISDELVVFGSDYAIRTKQVLGFVRKS